VCVCAHALIIGGLPLYKDINIWKQYFFYFLWFIGPLKPLHVTNNLLTFSVQLQISPI